MFILQFNTWFLNVKPLLLQDKFILDYFILILKAISYYPNNEGNVIKGKSVLGNSTKPVLEINEDGPLIPHSLCV